MWNFAGAWRPPLLSLGLASQNGKRTILTISLEALKKLREESKTTVLLQKQLDQILGNAFVNAPWNRS
jgi:hypothetical protein